MTYRVIQWATGAMGRTCLQAVIDHPDMELAGLYVYGDRKAGRDAGEIARRDPVGVTATRDIDDILALDADVVIHAARLDPPFERHDADICRLLRSGKNVISINGGTHPPHWPDARRAAFEAAGREGGTTFMGAGLNPGFCAERLAVLATSVCTRVDRITIHELVDCREVKSPEYVFAVIGFGTPAGKIDPNAPDFLPAQTMNALFAEVVANISDRLGWTFDTIRTAHALRPAKDALDIRAGRIEPGDTARVDWRWIGEAGGETRVDLGVSWTMEPPAPEETEAGLWSLKIAGRPGVEMTFGLVDTEQSGERASPEMQGVAGAVLNTIPHVVAAAPGVASTPTFTHWRASA